MIAHKFKRLLVIVSLTSVFLLLAGGNISAAPTVAPPIDFPGFPPRPGQDCYEPDLDCLCAIFDCLDELGGESVGEATSEGRRMKPPFVQADVAKIQICPLYERDFIRRIWVPSPTVGFLDSTNGCITISAHYWEAFCPPVSPPQPPLPPASPPYSTEQVAAKLVVFEELAHRVDLWSSRGSVYWGSDDGFERELADFRQKRRDGEATFEDLCAFFNIEIKIAMNLMAVYVSEVNAQYEELRLLAALLERGEISFEVWLQNYRQVEGYGTSNLVRMADAEKLVCKKLDFWQELFDDPEKPESVWVTEDSLAHAKRAKALLVAARKAAAKAYAKCVADSLIRISEGEDNDGE